MFLYVQGESKNECWCLDRYLFSLNVNISHWERNKNEKPIKENSAVQNWTRVSGTPCDNDVANLMDVYMLLSGRPKEQTKGQDDYVYTDDLNQYTGILLWTV